MAFFEDKLFFYGIEQHDKLETHTNILWLDSIYSIIQSSFLVREQHRAQLIQEELKVCWELKHLQWSIPAGSVPDNKMKHRETFSFGSSFT